MAGAGNSAGNRWTNASTFCPPQYTRVFDGESGPVYSCDYGACITVRINGNPFSRTWWNFGGETVTEFAPVAKAQLGTWTPTASALIAVESAGNPHAIGVVGGALVRQPASRQEAIATAPALQARGWNFSVAACFCRSSRPA